MMTPEGVEILVLGALIIATVGVYCATKPMPKCPRCLKEFKPGEISRMLDDTINTPQLYHSECYDSIAREIERKKEIYRDKPYKPS